MRAPRGCPCPASISFYAPSAANGRHTLCAFLYVRAVGWRPANGYVSRLGHQCFYDAQLLHLGVFLLLALLRWLLTRLHERFVGRGRVFVHAPLTRHPGVVAYLDRLVDDQQREKRHGEQYAGHGDTDHKFPPSFVQVETGQCRERIVL